MRAVRILVDVSAVIDRMRKLADDMTEINEHTNALLCQMAADVMIAQAEELETLKGKMP